MDDKPMDDKKVTLHIQVEQYEATCLHCWMNATIGAFLAAVPGAAISPEGKVMGDSHYIATVLGLVISDIIAQGFDVEDITAFLNQVCRVAVEDSGGIMNVDIVHTGSTPKAGMN